MGSEAVTQLTRRLQIISAFLIFISITIISGCSLSGQAVALLRKPTSTETVTLVPTSTPPPTLTPAFTPTAAPTPNFSAAIIRLEDLPSGFQTVSADDMAKINFSEATLANSVGLFATDARPRNLFVFLKTVPKLELVTGLSCIRFRRLIARS